MKNPIKMINPEVKTQPMVNYPMPTFSQKNYGHTAGSTTPGMSNMDPGNSAITSGDVSQLIKEFDYEGNQPPTSSNVNSFDPLKDVQSQKQDNRRLEKARKSAKRYNDRNPNNKVVVPVGKGTQALRDQINKPPADYSLPPIDIKQAIKDMTGKTNSPFGMMDQQYDQINPQGTAPMMGAPQQPSNTMGNAQPIFNPNSINAAQQIYGSQDQRTMSMPLNTQFAPLNFVDQTGDGKITYGDVVKARVEGYEE